MKTLLYILFFSISAISFAQDPQLFENDWYLQNVIIDGVDNFPPSNDGVPFVSITFIENNSHVSTSVCDMIDGTVIYTNSQFLIDGWSMTLGGCSGPFEQENALFQGIYLDTFFIGNVDDPFIYIIIEENSSKSLIITSITGDEAIYSNQLLSRHEFGLSKLSIHPNPASDLFYITTTNPTENLKVKIFNIEGKLLSTQNVVVGNQSSVNVSQLSQGIYFINIQDENGKIEIKKFIKE